MVTCNMYNMVTSNQVIIFWSQKFSTEVEPHPEGLNLPSARTNKSNFRQDKII